jgi:KDO2-lipid IV(A) lauroyltransferase
MSPLDEHDRRQGGGWTLPQAAKNHLLYGAAQGLLLALRLVPPRALPWLGSVLGRALYRLQIGRRLTLENLARVYPGLASTDRDALATRTYAQLGRYLGDTLSQLYRPGDLIVIPFEDGSRQVLEEALGEGRGVLFASAHLGPWERVAGSLVRHGFSLTTLARESYDSRFLRLYDRLRAGVGVRVIYRGSQRAPVQIVRALRRGELLGAPMDLRSRVPSVHAPFLGVLSETAVGPARIALRTRAPVVVGTACRGPSGALALQMTRIPTRDLTPGDTGERELTGRLNAELSRRILAFPEGWVWMHPRWAGPCENSAPSAEETR